MTIEAESHAPATSSFPLKSSSAGPVAWSQLTELPVDPRWLGKQKIVSFQRRHKAALAFDIMRTKLLKAAREQGWKTLGITSPDAGCGKATVAANLAISLTKHEQVRVALVDLDLRRPGIAQIFAIKGRYSTEEYLRGECLPEDFLVRVGDNLAIGASSDSTGYPAELLHGPGAAQMLERLRQGLGADMLIFNLPSMLESDDCLGLLPQVEAALLVVGADHSTVDDIDVCERELRAQTRMLGVVLNKCRYAFDQNVNFQL